MAQGRLLLVDGHSFAYRAFFAIQRLSDSKGEPTNAAYGFAKMVRKLLQDEKPAYGAVVMDLGEPAKRLEKLKGYKAQRKPMPNDLRSQIPLIHEFTKTSGIPLIEKDGVEADDIIATLALQSKVLKLDVAIATSDKDFMQLVDDSIASLLQQFASIQQLYERLNELDDEKLRQKLLDHRDQVELNRELVRLDTTVPLDVTPTQLALGRPDFAALVAWCDRLEFRTLREEILRESLKADNPELSLGV